MQGPLHGFEAHLQWEHYNYSPVQEDFVFLGDFTMEIPSDMFLKSTTGGQWREGSALFTQDNLWQRFPEREIPRGSSHPYLFFLTRASDVGPLTV